MMGKSVFGWKEWPGHHGFWMHSLLCLSRPCSLLNTIVPVCCTHSGIFHFPALTLWVLSAWNTFLLPLCLFQLLLGTTLAQCSMLWLFSILGLSLLTPKSFSAALCLSSVLIAHNSKQVWNTRCSVLWESENYYNPISFPQRIQSLERTLAAVIFYCIS